ncbi:MAG TPA: 30S ribosomal protein S6 [Catalimonadaceae bacterium]|nr:30S ribosomal protein S6 [Catalimonadaceae bacterium]
MLKNYETVFILTPVLSDQQTKDAVEKYKNLITGQGGQVVNLENMGLKQLAYPIQKKSNGFYVLIEFQAEPSFVKTLEVEYKRDERIIRFLTTALDKYAVEYNAKRRSGAFNQAKETSTVTA